MLITLGGTRRTQSLSWVVYQVWIVWSVSGALGLLLRIQEQTHTKGRFEDSHPGNGWNCENTYLWVVGVLFLSILISGTAFSAFCGSMSSPQLDSSDLIYNTFDKSPPAEKGFWEKIFCLPKLFSEWQAPSPNEHWHRFPGIASKDHFCSFFQNFKL